MHPVIAGVFDNANRGERLNVYRFPASRLAVGLVALAMSALSFGLMVVLPSQTQGNAGIDPILAAPSDAAGSCMAPALPASDESVRRAPHG